MSTNATDPLAARIATLTDDQIIAAAQVLDQIAKPTPDQRLTKAYLLDALELRHPEIIPALDAWIESDDHPGTYTTATIAAVRNLANA